MVYLSMRFILLGWDEGALVGGAHMRDHARAAVVSGLVVGGWWFGGCHWLVLPVFCRYMPAEACTTTIWQAEREGIMASRARWRRRSQLAQHVSARGLFPR
ncbi:hypothetical protein PLESTB_000786200 [Pleodorina starrii]|uniref:Uncharacterized protein n=1 Tax=Pleodorina starrii TaxID=330485 RepID=A0A9W6BKP6_9CHLO|nr:hypothetical protein PLESTB_000786200 [Pleodorina starrii]